MGGGYPFWFTDVPPSQSMLLRLMVTSVGAHEISKEFCFWSETGRLNSLMVIRYGGDFFSEIVTVNVADGRGDLDTRQEIDWCEAGSFKSQFDEKLWPDPDHWISHTGPGELEFQDIGEEQKAVWLSQKTKTQGDPGSKGGKEKEDNNWGQGGGTEHVAIIIDDSIGGGGDAENPRSRNQLQGP